MLDNAFQVIDRPPAREAARHAARGFDANGRPPAVEKVGPAAWSWLAGALDELDYGIVLLFGGAVVHVNHAAHVELDDGKPMHLTGHLLRARSGRDTALLQDAIQAAAAQGLRRLLTLGGGADTTTVSIVPLAAAEGGERAVLVVLGKRAVSEALSLEGFARGHHLTGAETRVLAALCDGCPPLETAHALGVAISTVRSHIGNIRAKTGASSIRALVRQVSVLPPIMGALRNPGSAVGLRPAG